MNFNNFLRNGLSMTRISLISKVVDTISKMRDIPLYITMEPQAIPKAVVAVAMTAAKDVIVEVEPTKLSSISMEME